jgi:LysR family transcriptional activator of glutamate synthase operon
MDLTTLKCFVSLAELGSLTAAAEVHHLTQPAVSIRLRKLEAELGAKLFYLSGRRMRLTSAGERAVAAARRMLRDAGELIRELADNEGLAQGRIAIGTIDAASSYVLPPVFSRFRERYPGVEIHLEVSATAVLLRLLREGALEIAVGTLPVERSGEYEIHPIYRERLLLIAPPGHPLSRAKRLTPRDIADAPFISFHRGATTRRIIEKELARHGAAPRVTITTDSPEAIRNLVAAGLGLAILPERLVRDDVRRGAVHVPRISGLVFERSLGLIIPSRRYLPETVRAFLGVLADELGVALPGRLIGRGAPEKSPGGAGQSLHSPSSAGRSRRKDA